MARNQETVTVTPENWTQLTLNDASKISFQIVSGLDADNGVYIRGTSDTTAPTETYGLQYRQYYGELARPLADLFIGLTSPTRVWAKAIKRPVVLLVSDDAEE